MSAAVVTGAYWIQICPKKHMNGTLIDYLGLFHDFTVIMGLAMFDYIMVLKLSF